MMKWLVVLSFVAGAALSWGVYVPVVHRAAFELKSKLRAFMFVGALTSSSPC
jgi:purine-cytosine permease-like protein